VSQFNQVSRSQQATKDLNQLIRGFFITVTKKTIGGHLHEKKKNQF